MCGQSRAPSAVTAPGNSGTAGRTRRASGSIVGSSGPATNFRQSASPRGAYDRRFVHSALRFVPAEHTPEDPADGGAGQRSHHVHPQ